MKAAFISGISILAATEAAAHAGDWTSTLLNYGIAGLWIAWFIHRDRKQSAREDEKHAENLAALNSLSAGIGDALKEERQFFIADIEADRKSRHEVAESVHHLALAFATAGIRVEPRPRV